MGRPLVPIGTNPNPYIAPGVTLQQYAYNVATLGRAYLNIPPYLLGYNPYQSGGYAQAPLAYNPGLSTTYNPYVGNPYMGASGYGGPTLSTTPGAPGYDPSLSTYPGGSNYGGYNPYGYNDPTAQLANGVANLTSATAQYYVTIQRARLVQEEVTRSRLETRRKILEQAERERAMQPNPEVERQKDIENSLVRARNDPPLTELLSGKTLNDLLNNLEKQQAKNFRGPNVPLDEIDLTQINVGPGNEAGNIGLVRNLKQGDKLTWPVAVRGEAYAEAREKLDARLPGAVSLLRTQKPLGDGDIRDLEDSAKKMIETLNANIGDLSPTQYITAKRFLSQLTDAISAMKSPGAMNYFNGVWVAKSKNVAELVNYMKEKGLRFNAASPGGDAAYRALYFAFITYDANMTLIATK